MSPEKRAERVAPIGTRENAGVARLIRAAENAALERAARAVVASELMQDIRIVDVIRDLKTKSPK